MPTRTSHMHKGYKAIGSVVVVVVVVVDTKITKAGDLVTRVSCKCNESVKFGQKLASVCLESIGTHALQASQIVLAIS